jgi:hypothetical protein
MKLTTLVHLLNFITIIVLLFSLGYSVVHLVNIEAKFESQDYTLLIVLLTVISGVLIQWVNSLRQDSDA